jgi:uncharacterized membrane protein
MSDSTPQITFFRPERLKALTDGVTAIVITLLVLELTIPVVDEIPGSEGLWPELRHQWREYLSYFVSFFIVGILWLYHHNVFRYIRRADGTLLFLNMLFLLAVSLMPFTSGLVASNWDERLAAIIYGSSMFLAAGANAACFAYASWKRRLTDAGLDAYFIRSENLGALVVLALIALSAGLGYFSAIYTYSILGAVVVFYWTITALNREGVSVRRREWHGEELET